MREIKFRAWEMNYKEIIDVDSINFESKIINTECAWRMFSEVILMQYTGLKDKNGREIYEKDIVEIKHTYDYMAFDGYERSWTITKGEVAFNYAGFDVKYLDRDGEPVWSGITLMECLSDMVSEWEVIGNIFENPELLEVNK